MALKVHSSYTKYIITIINTMKQTTLQLALIASLVLYGGVAYAEDTSAEVSAKVTASTTKPGFFQMIKNRITKQDGESREKPEIKDMRKGEMGSTTEMRDEKGEDRSHASTSVNKIKDKMEDKMDKYREEMNRGRIHQFTNMLQRFDKTILRLQDILARLESRIAKIKANGGVATTTDAFIVKAHTDIGLAQTSFLSLSALASTTAMNNTAHGTSTLIASSTLLQLRKLSEETTKHINDAQKDMQKAIVNLKGVNGEIHSNEEVHATSTKNEQ